MNTIELDVQGMTCGSCVKHVTQALQTVPGVSRVEVDLNNGRALVEGTLDAGGAPLIAALARADYPAKLALGNAPKPAATAEDGQIAPKGESGCCCR